MQGISLMVAIRGVATVLGRIVLKYEEATVHAVATVDVVVEMLGAEERDEENI